MKWRSFNWGSKIREEAADLHRDAETRGMEKANSHFRRSALALRLLEFYRNSPD